MELSWLVTFNCEQAKNNLDMAMSCYNIVP